MDAQLDTVQANLTEQRIHVDLLVECASKITRMAASIDGLDEQLANHCGKLTHHLDTQHSELTSSIDDARLDRMATMIDKLVAQVETDGEERTALDHQVQRNEGWIQQVATEAGVKLSYER